MASLLKFMKKFNSPTGNLGGIFGDFFNEKHIGLCIGIFDDKCIAYDQKHGDIELKKEDIISYSYRGLSKPIIIDGTNGYVQLDKVYDLKLKDGSNATLNLIYYKESLSTAKYKDSGELQLKFNLIQYREYDLSKLLNILGIKEENKNSQSYNNENNSTSQVITKNESSFEKQLRTPELSFSGDVNGSAFPLGTCINFESNDCDDYILFTYPDKKEEKITHEMIKCATVLSMGVIDIKEGNVLYGVKYLCVFKDGRQAILTVGISKNQYKVEKVLF